MSDLYSDNANGITWPRLNKSEIEALLTIFSRRKTNMKANKRNRKLTFIRSKNKIRIGMPIHQVFKISVEMLKYGPENIIKEISLDIEKRASKYWKIPMKVISEHITEIQNDRLLNIKSVLIKLKKAKS